VRMMDGLHGDRGHTATLNELATQTHGGNTKIILTDENGKETLFDTSNLGKSAKMGQKGKNNGLLQLGDSDEEGEAMKPAAAPTRSLLYPNVGPARDPIHNKKKGQPHAGHRVPGTVSSIASRPRQPGVSPTTMQPPAYGGNHAYYPTQQGPPASSGPYQYPPPQQYSYAPPANGYYQQPFSHTPTGNPPHHTPTGPPSGYVASAPSVYGRSTSASMPTVGGAERSAVSAPPASRRDMLPPSSMSPSSPNAATLFATMFGTEARLSEEDVDPAFQATLLSQFAAQAQAQQETPTRGLHDRTVDRILRNTDMLVRVTDVETNEESEEPDFRGRQESWETLQFAYNNPQPVNQLLAGALRSRPSIDSNEGERLVKKYKKKSGS
jgi:hypothetical protein